MDMKKQEIKEDPAWKTALARLRLELEEAEARKAGRQADDKTQWQDFVPRELSDFNDRFDPKQSERLPKPSQFDMNLKRNEKPLQQSKVIHLNAENQKIIDKWVEDKLKKKWIITTTKIEALTPVFIILKADRGD